MDDSSIASATSVFSGSSSSDALSANVMPAMLNPFYTISVKTHVPITLQLTRPNFNRWSTFFKAMVGKFSFLPFLDASVPAHPEDLVWEQTDYAIKSWLCR
jgi:hypothetical protein